MSVRRSRKQMERIKKARSAKSGRFVVVVQKRGAGRAVPKARTYGGLVVESRGGSKDPQQPQPKIPLLSGGKDPTLGERFEEELYHP